MNRLNQLSFFLNPGELPGNQSSADEPGILSPDRIKLYFG